VRPILLLVVPAGIALAALAYEVQVNDLYSPRDRAIATVVVGLSFMLAGLFAWYRRRANRLGPLMVAAGFALLLRQLRYSEEALVFTIFFLLGELGYALVAHSTLAYPPDASPTGPSAGSCASATSPSSPSPSRSSSSTTRPTRCSSTGRCHDGA
jgi:hypothetical protein